MILDKECVVVGLGSGEHIAEMVNQKKLEKIYVIDSRPELVPAFKSKFPELETIVETIILRTTGDLFRHEIMSKVIEKTLSTFAYTASWPAGDPTLAIFHRHLTGRSQESLQLFFDRRGMTQKVEVREEAGNRYLSIKDLEVLIQEDVSPFLRLNCFRILKELII